MILGPGLTLIGVLILAGVLGWTNRQGRLSLVNVKAPETPRSRLLLGFGSLVGLVGVANTIIDGLFPGGPLFALFHVVLGIAGFTVLVLVLLRERKRS